MNQSQAWTDLTALKARWDQRVHVEIQESREHPDTKAVQAAQEVQGTGE
jgi:hypothetical protein